MLSNFAEYWFSVNFSRIFYISSSEKEMKPPEVVASPPGISSDKLPKPNEVPTNNGGSGEIGVGVLPIPGQPQQPAPQQGNLDAQEDDGDRPLKDELIQQDDQSPDGDLQHKEPKDNGQGVVPVPILLKNQANPRNNAGGLSGQQEEREAAHLRVPQEFDANNNL